MTGLYIAARPVAPARVASGGLDPANGRGEPPPQLPTVTDRGSSVYARSVPELVWVAAVLLLLGAIGAVELVPWEQLLQFGNQLMLDGAAVGIPLELIYYIAVGLALTHIGRRPQGWYWRPFQHHHLLSRTQKLIVFPWFVSGALAFLGIVLGITITVLGMIGAIVQTR